DLNGDTTDNKNGTAEWLLVLSAVSFFSPPCPADPRTWSPERRTHTATPSVIQKLPQGIRRALRLAPRRPAIEAAVDAQPTFQLETRAAALVSRALTPDAARAEARRMFGDTNHWRTAMSAVDRERVAEQGRTEWLGDLRQDLR